MARSPLANAALPALLALLCVGALTLLYGDVGLNLTDEGFLWYGVERMLQGEVPMRDFQAYDPGRYVWCAAWSPLFGHGLLGVRAGVALFQGIGLLCGLLAFRRVTGNPVALAFIAALLCAWMFPRQKLFEPAIALMAVYVALRWLERPGPRAALAAGAFTGLATWFGCNHGLYLVLVFLLVALWLWWKDERARDRRTPLHFVLGGIAGSAPLWGMLLFVPGFAGGYLESLRIIVAHGVNRPEPFPWPWQAELSASSGFDRWAGVAVAWSFLLPLLLVPAGLLVAARSSRADLPRRSVAVAAALVGCVYVHHMLVRSDIGHLAQCIPPLLLLALALPHALLLAAPARVAVWGGMGVLALLVGLDSNPALAHLAPGKPRLVEQEVAGDTLRLYPALAKSLSGVEAVVRERVGPREELYVGPTRPSYYALLAKRSPLWWIYQIRRATAEEQRDFIERLDGRPVRWALVVDAPANDREDLRLSVTNPEVWRHLLDHYERVTDARLPEGHVLFQRREAASR